MNWKMMIVFIVGFVSGVILGAIGHENDLSRNYRTTGDACAWFYDIKAQNNPSIQPTSKDGG